MKLETLFCIGSLATITAVAATNPLTSPAIFVGFLGLATRNIQNSIALPLTNKKNITNQIKPKQHARNIKKQPSLKCREGTKLNGTVTFEDGSKHPICIGPTIDPIIPAEIQKGDVEKNVNNLNSLIFLKTTKGICSGVIIDKQHILTAAHCVKTLTKPPLNLENINAFAGSIAKSDYLNEQNSYFLYKVIDGFYNIAFNEKNQTPEKDDIAVLKTDRLFPSSWISPIPTLRECQYFHQYLANDVSSITSSTKPKLKIVGWGNVEGNKPTNHPHSVLLAGAKTLPNDPIDSRIFYSKDPDNKEQEITINKSTCRGDSGGGVYHIGNNSQHLIGIVEGAYGSCDHGSVASYGLYIDLCHYSLWIKNRIKANPISDQGQLLFDINKCMSVKGLGDSPFFDFFGYRNKIKFVVLNKCKHRVLTTLNFDHGSEIRALITKQQTSTIISTKKKRNIFTAHHRAVYTSK